MSEGLFAVVRGKKENEPAGETGTCGRGLENVKAYTVSARSCKMGDTESKIPNGKSI